MGEITDLGGEFFRRRQDTVPVRFAGRERVEYGITQVTSTVEIPGLVKIELTEDDTDAGRCRVIDRITEHLELLKRRMQS